MKLKFMYVIFSALCVLFLAAGCKESNDSSDENAGYVIYYTNASLDKLTEEAAYKDLNLEPFEAAKLLLDRMNNPKEKQNVSVFASGISPSEISLSDGVLYVSFPEGYLNLDDVSKVLIRSAVVKTLTQIDGIDYVSIYINEQPLANHSGVFFGVLNDSNFIDDKDISHNVTQSMDLTIYYSDLTGKSLVGEVVSIEYSNSTPIEKVVMDRLIDGPQISAGSRSVPKDLKVLSVSTKESVCYINFDESFLNSIADVTAQVTLYSIVNTLCELPNINKVQILVNGSQDGMFRETYSLSSVYERDLNLVTSTYLSPAR